MVKISIADLPFNNPSESGESSRYLKANSEEKPVNNRHKIRHCLPLQKAVKNALIDTQNQQTWRLLYIPA